MGENIILLSLLASCWYKLMLNFTFASASFDMCFSTFKVFADWTASKWDNPINSNKPSFIFTNTKYKRLNETSDWIWRSKIWTFLLFARKKETATWLNSIGWPANADKKNREVCDEIVFLKQVKNLHSHARYFSSLAGEN